METVSKKLVDLEKLKSWMDKQNLPDTSPDDEISNVELLAGGTQNILLKFSRGEQTFVLRRPPEHLRKNSNETMRREARVLAAIADSKVPHPKLIAACPEEDVIGASFYLMQAIDLYMITFGSSAFHLSGPVTFCPYLAVGIAFSLLFN